jgi:hypothetical protein
VADTWVIRCFPNPPASELWAARPDRITIVATSSQFDIDETRHLFIELMQLSEKSNWRLPALGLAVAGGDPNAARQMWETVRETMRGALSPEITVLACEEEIDAVGKRADRWRFNDKSSASLQSVVQWIREASNVHPLITEHQRPYPEPKPLIGVVPSSLVEHIEGLAPLAIRCPGQEDIELAVDSTGWLHVLIRDRQLRALRIVEAWTHAHRRLIARACSDRWVDTAGKTVSHVFTEEPASVADLQGTDLRLHVLTPLKGQRRWYYAPLNRAHE